MLEGGSMSVLEEKYVEYACFRIPISSQLISRKLEMCNNCRKTRPPQLVQRCNDTTAGLGYLEVNVIFQCKSPHWAVD
jgi:hypothetical protein